MSVKISELPNATSVTSSDVVPIVQNGETKQANLGIVASAGGVPTGSILQYDGNTIPAGYEEVNGFDNYSTTEQRVGTWIDGKPLYRKCYQLTNLPTANNYTDISIDFTMSDIFPVKLETTLKSDWGTYFTTFVGSNNSYVSSSLAVNNLQTNPIQIRIRSSIDIHTYIGYAILSYTKTTDSAS